MKTTDNLTNVLKKAKPDDVDSILEEYEGKIVSSDRPFAEYMRQCIREKGLKQQDIFLAADIPEGYGYKLISEQKRTRQRDIIMRLCFAARLTLDEIQRALKLYGLAPLYSRLPRDAVLMIAANNEVYDLAAVNELLAKHGMETLLPCGNTENT